MTYELTGRLDTISAPKVEAELMEAFAANGELELDALALDYVSSAGLRVLLKLRKAQGKLTVKNVSQTVYEIFDVTGFTDLLDIQRA